MIHSCLVCVRATCFCFFFFIFLLTRSVTERGMPRTTGTLQWRLRVVLRPQSQVQRRIPESIIDPRQKQIVFSASLQPICLTNKVRADNFVLPLITVNLLLSAVCVCLHAVILLYSSSSSCIAEERNNKAHAENGNTAVSFPARVQPPAPCIPQMRRRVLLPRAPFCSIFSRFSFRGWRRSSSITPSSRSFARCLPRLRKSLTGISCSGGSLQSPWPPSWGRISLLLARIHYYITCLARMLWCDHVQSMVSWVALLIFAGRRDAGICTSKPFKFDDFFCHKLSAKARSWLWRCLLFYKILL